MHRHVSGPPLEVRWTPTLSFCFLRLQSWAVGSTSSTRCGRLLRESIDLGLLGGCAETLIRMLSLSNVDERGLGRVDGQ